MLHHAKVKVCINYLVKPEKIQAFPSDLSRAAYLNFTRMGRIFFFSLSENLSSCCVFYQLKCEQNHRMMIFLSPSFVMSRISISCPRWRVWSESIPLRPIQLAKPFWMYSYESRVLCNKSLLDANVNTAEHFQFNF